MLPLFIIKNGGSTMAKDYSELVFSDDFMFCKVLVNNPDICRELISLILKKDISNIKIPEKQKPIEITADGKGIRLDVYVEGEDEDVVYDIEMQTTLNKNLPKRTRYYQGMIDLDLIERGADFSELKKSYIIFVCLTDPFDRNASVYTMQNRCDEFDDLYLNDEAIKIFLNAKGNSKDISTDLKDFLNYIATGKAEGSFSKAIEKEVEKARNKEEWRTEYMTLEMRYKEKFNEGRAEGKAEGLAEGIAKERNTSILNMLKSGKTPEQISEFCGYTIDEIMAVKMQ